MIVQVVAEQLNVRDRRGRHRWIGKVAREENERNVSNVIRISEVGQVSYLKRWVAT